MEITFNRLSLGCGHGFISTIADSKEHLSIKEERMDAKYQVGRLLMNIDARVAELKHSNIPDSHISYFTSEFALYVLYDFIWHLVKMHEHSKYYNSHCKIIK